jgi:DNA-directed RNA polymerase specialized sigma24 family protein
MASGPEAESSPHDETFAELARRIQAGDRTATQTFRSMFLPGIEFLLRRKLERSPTAVEAARVLAEAIQEIEAGSPANAISLPQLVARTIHRLYPSSTGSQESRAEDPHMNRVANSVLATKTPLEQDILRRYYVLGESADKIRMHLRIDLRTVEQTIASARAEFWGKRQGSSAGGNGS